MNKFIIFQYNFDNKPNSLLINSNDCYLSFLNITENKPYSNILYRICLETGNFRYIGKVITPIIKQKIISDYLDFLSNEHSRLYDVDSKIELFIRLIKIKEEEPNE